MSIYEDETIEIMVGDDLNLEKTSPLSFANTAEIQQRTETARKLNRFEYIIESFMGITFGSVAGWITGLIFGNFYTKIFQPMYLHDMDTISYWWKMPFTFAKVAMLVGAVIGLALMIYIKNKSFEKKIVDIYRNQTTESLHMRLMTGLSDKKIQKTIHNLINKGRLVYVA